ncbi:MAG: TonB-dependent receptor [Deltaproteobacteria bacterium]
MRMISIILLVLPLALLPTPTRAEGLPESAPPEVETLVVTGSRAPQPLELLPGSVEVISRKEIEASKYDGVVDVIRNLPGLHVQQAGTRGSLASIYMRGLDPNHTLILLDGVVLNDPTNARGGSFDLSTLDLLNLEQIEVVRGPVSAVHGSDALAGAIQIRTRGGKGEDEAMVDLSGGRFGYFRGMASARGERGPVDLAIAGSWVREGVPDELGGYDGGSVLAHAGVALPGEGELRGTLRYGDSHSAAYPVFSGGVEYALLQGEFEVRDVEELDIGLTWEQRVHEKIEAALWATTTQRWEHLRSPGVPPEAPGEPGTTTRLERYSASGRVTADPGAGLTLTLGGDVEWQVGSSRGALDFGGVVVPGLIDFDLNRLTGAPFAEAHLESSFGLVVQAGLRVDIPDDYASEVSSRLSASWAIAETGLSWNGSWGEGFKLPSFYALGNPIVGNRDLVPERSRGWDLGVGWEFLDARANASLTYFDLDVENLIDFNSDTFLLENLAQVESNGVEAELRLEPIAGVAITAHATWNDVRDSETGTRLLNRPKWRGGLGLLWQVNHAVETRLQALFVGPLPAESVPTGVVTLGAYQRVDLAISWQALPWLQVYITIDNLLDQRFQEEVGIPAPGIRPRAGVQARFSGL